MKLLPGNQGTQQWFENRAGKVTASRVIDAVSFLKRDKTESAARKAYKAEIITEILTGKPNMDGFLSSAMEWGNAYEDEARTSYEVARSVIVDRIGFALHPTIERAGSSPDGLVGYSGGLEIKCPKTETHLDYILADEVPEKYRPQMLWCMVCCERSWWDFASYDPRLPEPLQLFVKRLERDEQRIAELEDGVRLFLGEVDETIARLKGIVGEFQPVRSEPVYAAEDGYLTDADFEGLL